MLLLSAVCFILSFYFLRWVLLIISPVAGLKLMEILLLLLLSAGHAELALHFFFFVCFTCFVYQVSILLCPQSLGFTDRDNF